MNDINLRVLELINDNKSMKEIASSLNISEKQLYIRIKTLINYGYQIKPNYNYDSDIYYKIIKKLYEQKNNKVDIKIPNNINEFRCLAISDIHIGNLESNIKLIDSVYEYAAKNNINIIFNCGDIIEGAYTTDRKFIKDTETQLEYFLKKYPYDRNINNFVILGNHDYHSLYYEGLDISKRMRQLRYDIIPIGYGKGVVKLKDDSLLLSHELSVVENSDIGDNCNLVLVGHGHKMKTKLYDKLYLCLPTLSSVSPDRTKEVIPGFIDVTIHFDRRQFEFIEAKHLIVTEKIYEVSESRCRMKTLFKNNRCGNK